MVLVTIVKDLEFKPNSDSDPSTFDLNFLPLFCVLASMFWLWKLRLWSTWALGFCLLLLYLFSSYIIVLVHISLPFYVLGTWLSPCIYFLLLRIENFLKPVLSCWAGFLWLQMMRGDMVYSGVPICLILFNSRNFFSISCDRWWSYSQKGIHQSKVYTRPEKKYPSHREQ